MTQDLIFIYAITAIIDIGKHVDIADEEEEGEGERGEEKKKRKEKNRF